MSPSRNQNQLAGPARGAGRVFGRVLGIALFAYLCGSAQAQDPAVDRMVAHDALRLVRHPDARVRGEAALVAASGHDRDMLAQILPLAADSQAACRHRALLALGIVGSPVAVDALDTCLRAGTGRSDADLVVAAFALGMAPEEVASGAITRLLASIVQGSYKRQRDLLLALLHGIERQDERHDGAALRRLFDDESNRDPEVRALLLALLLPVDPSLRGEPLGRVLERGELAERLAALRWLGSGDLGIDGSLLPVLERIAHRATAPEERSLALAALARVHHVRAVELATRALRSSDGTEAAHGVAALLALGGARMRTLLEQRLLDANDADQLARLLPSYRAPMSAALVERCAAAAADPKASPTARAIAAVALAQQQPARAGALLRDAFRGADAATDLLPMASALMRYGSELPTVARLLPDGSELLDHPARWSALVRAGHPEARRALLQQLSAPNAGPAALATSLAVWRRAEVLPPPARHGSTLPAVLRDLLAD